MTSDQLAFGNKNKKGANIPSGQGVPPQKLDILEGILENFVFSNDDNGWSVVRLNVKGNREPVTAVGSLIGVQPGESVRLEGYWVSDRKYGDQFKAQSFTTIKPATLVGIEKYLGSGMIKGIGPVMASRMVNCFGVETLDIIETSPARLLEVEGIGKVRIEGICQAWQEQKDIKEVMIFLQSHGVTTTYAIKIYKEYGNKAIDIVSENPYRLAVDIFGIGFRTADKIASNIGIAANSPQRAEAGILHVLGSFSEDGHVCCPRALLVEKAAEMLEIDDTIVEHAVDSLSVQGLVVIESVAECTVAEGSDVAEETGDELIYLRSLYASEVGAARLMRQVLESDLVRLNIDIDKAIGGFEKEFSIELAWQQRDAIKRAIKSKMMVVTGGPGTGKTTLINGVIQILKGKERRVLLAAPTGRAAKRLSEATGMEAKTIHRLLEFSPRAMSFERGPDNPLEVDILILDEVSMVDIVLFYNVLKALPMTSQIVLVGDVDQLPSVGPGGVLKDVIASGCVEVVCLTEVFRQARESMVVMNAHAINSGKMPYVKGEGHRRDFFVIEKDEPEEVLETIKTLITQRIPAHFGFSPTDDIQVLTPMHKGLLGTSNLNKELQELLNPEQESISRGSRTFRVADKVMQIRNNYDLDVFNGDIGKIASIDRVERVVRVNFEGKMVLYEQSDLDELMLAYACSVHKAQGSEYPVVVLPLHTQHYMMLQRNLLYTAVTRGKKLVVVVGSKKALAIAVKNNKIQDRFTRLAERLNG
ncbi:MAG: ATP-dependent RecD-like DNA helicase [Actinomycetota bacterium]|nr:ATP-dependent RecD-like DNA helicase [Actinomycetota bacterium]